MGSRGGAVVGGGVVGGAVVGGGVVGGGVVGSGVGSADGSVGSILGSVGSMLGSVGGGVAGALEDGVLFEELLLRLVTNAVMDKPPQHNNITVNKDPKAIHNLFRLMKSPNPPEGWEGPGV